MNWANIFGHRNLKFDSKWQALYAKGPMPIDITKIDIPSPGLMKYSYPLEDDTDFIFHPDNLKYTDGPLLT